MDICQWMLKIGANGDYSQLKKKKKKKGEVGLPQPDIDQAAQSLFPLEDSTKKELRGQTV